MAYDVNDVAPRVQYTATGGQTNFIVPFEFHAETDLKVYLTPTGNTPDDDSDVLTITTDYTVNDPATTGGGSIDLVASASAGDVVTIERDAPISRSSLFTNNGDLIPERLEEELDKLTMMIQQVEMFQQKRALYLQHTSTLTDALQLPQPLANQYIGWNASADQIINLTPYDPSAISVTAFAETLLDDTTATAARATLDASHRDDTETLTNKTVEDGVYTDTTNSTTINAIYDEDSMSSDDANGLATQQSIKAYVDTELTGNKLTLLTTRTNVLTSSNTDVTSWTNQSAGAPAGAAAAILRCSASVVKSITGTGVYQSNLYVKAVGSTETKGSICLVASANLNDTSSAITQDVDICFITVPLDGSGNFQYQIDETHVGTGTANVRIDLVGYYE